MNKTVYIQFSKLRIRWYAQRTGQLIVKHWQWFVLTLLLVPIGVPLEAFSHALAQPFIVSFDPKLSFFARVSVLAAMAVVAAFWVYPQRNTILGGPCATYFQSLSISKRTQFFTDITLILLASSLLLLPALAVLLSMNTIDTGPRLFKPLCYAAVLLFTMQLQYGLVKRRRFIQVLALLNIILLALSIEFAIATPAHWGLSWVCLLAVLCLSIASMHYRPSRTFTEKHEQPLRKLNARISSWCSQRYPALLILFKIFIENKLSSAFRIATMLAITLGTLKLYSLFLYDHRLPTVGLMSLTLLAVIASSFYRTFNTAHQHSREYQLALAMPKKYWWYRDSVAVIAITLPASFVVLLALFLTEKMSIGIGCTVLFSHLCLLLVLRPLTLYCGKQSVLLTFLVSVFWAIAMAILIA